MQESETEGKGKKIEGAKRANTQVLVTVTLQTDEKIKDKCDEEGVIRYDQSPNLSLHTLFDSICSILHYPIYLASCVCG